MGDSIARQNMFDALLLKFTQNRHLVDLLIATGNRTLYEAAPRDRTWGIGFSAKDGLLTSPDRYGQNLLGKALMRVRQALTVSDCVNE